MAPKQQQGILIKFWCIKFRTFESIQRFNFLNPQKTRHRRPKSSPPLRSPNDKRVTEIFYLKNPRKKPSAFHSTLLNQNVQIATASSSSSSSRRTTTHRSFTVQKTPPKIPKIEERTKGHLCIKLLVPEG